MNTIHPTAIIDSNVKLGNDNVIGAYVVIEGPAEIGDNNIISHHVVIGTPGQDTRNPRYDCSSKLIKIGNNNIIREFTAIQKPCYEDLTMIGNNVFLMQGVHIPHDAFICDDVVITPLSCLGGITKVLKGANIGMGATINQYTVIGQYSIVATNAPCMKNVRPFTKYVPGKPVKVNLYALKKYGFMDYFDEIEQYVMNGSQPVSDRIKSIVAEFEFWVNKYGHQTY